MSLTPPKKWVFWASLILAVVGLVGYLITIPFITGLAFWFVLAGYVLLAAGNALKGL